MKRGKKSSHWLFIYIESCSDMRLSLVSVCVWPVCGEREQGKCMSKRVGKADYDKLLNEQQVCCFV